MKKEHIPTSLKLMQFVDMAMKEAQQNALPPSQNEPLLDLIESVVKQAERVRGKAPLPVLPDLARRRLTTNELKALAVLVGYQSNNTGFHSELIKMAVECYFDVEDLSELTGAQFDDVVHYLVYFNEKEARP